jgi:hypothetical protein
VLALALALEGSSCRGFGGGVGVLLLFYGLCKLQVFNDKLLAFSFLEITHFADILFNNLPIFLFYNSGCFFNKGEYIGGM